MHIDVKQPHLGVGDPRQRLSVHARELQEGHERESGREHGGGVPERLDVVLGEVLEALAGEAEAGPEALDQRGLEAGGLGRVIEGACAVAVGEHVLEEAVGQAALLGRLADLLELVAAAAQSRHDPGVRCRRRGPILPIGGPHLRDHPTRGPASERGRGYPSPLRSFLEGERLVVHCVDATTAEALRGLPQPRAHRAPTDRLKAS